MHRPTDKNLLIKHGTYVMRVDEFCLPSLQLDLIETISPSIADALIALDGLVTVCSCLTALIEWLMSDHRLRFGHI
jgi:hypothetical protein